MLGLETVVTGSHIKHINVTPESRIYIHESIWDSDTYSRRQTKRGFGECRETGVFNVAVNIVGNMDFVKESVEVNAFSWGRLQTTFQQTYKSAFITQDHRRTQTVHPYVFSLTEDFFKSKIKVSSH